jgi:UDP-N-acetylglucosamine 4,6-dehydratase
MFYDRIQIVLMLNNKTILITGGTGSFGKKFVSMVLDQYSPKKLIVFSRDELKQFEMQQAFPQENIRFLIGDVRDSRRLERAFQGVDIVVHAAALKQVPATEYNPFEAVKTNILGAQNIIDAAINTNVKKVIALSTDKAASPTNLYGATKLCSDKLFVAANNVVGFKDISFSVVRYGNVLGSRGSVIPFFLDRRNDKILPITHPDMTRFSISLDDGVNLVLHAIEKSIGREVFIPKIPSYRIMDVAKAINPNYTPDYIGIRQGEKLHEEMLTQHDSLTSVETNKLYIIAPNLTTQAAFEKHYNANKLTNATSYNSKDNPHFLTVSDIRNEIQAHVDPNFSIQSTAHTL